MKPWWLSRPNWPHTCDDGDGLGVSDIVAVALTVEVTVTVPLPVALAVGDAVVELVELLDTLTVNVVVSDADPDEVTV